MSLRLSRGEFWLLSVLVRHGLALNILGMPELSDGVGRCTIVEMLNRRGHGLDVGALVRTLRSMARSGWIEFYERNPGPETPIDNATPSWLRKALIRPGRFVDAPYVALLPEGGAVWEHFARPDWDRFVDDWSEYEDALPDGTMRRVVTAVDEKFLHRYVEAVRRERVVTADSEQFSETGDWEMVYWKPPRHGYCWTATVKDGGYSPPSARWHFDLWCEWR